MTESTSTLVSRRMRYFAVVGCVAVALSSALVASPAAAQSKPKGAAVIGAGTTGAVSFEIDARAAKRSSAATGTVAFHFGFADVYGTVTCVQAQGGLAGVSGTLNPETTLVDPVQSPGFFLYVEEGSATVPDLMQLSLVGFVPSSGDCAPQIPVSPSAVTTGDIVIFPGKST